MPSVISGDANVSATEFGFLDGVTSSLQSQIDGKQTIPAATSWTPTYNNLTIGNGTVVAGYVVAGKLLTFDWRFTLGSTSSVGTNPQIVLPATPANEFVFSILLQDSGTSSIVGTGFAGTDGLCSMFVNKADQANVYFASVTATSPFTWTTGDVIRVAATYRTV